MALSWAELRPSGPGSGSAGGLAGRTKPSAPAARCLMVAPLFARHVCMRTPAHGPSRTGWWASPPRPHAHLARRQSSTVVSRAFLNKAITCASLEACLMPSTQYLSNRNKGAPPVLCTAVPATRHSTADRISLRWQANMLATASITCADIPSDPLASAEAGITVHDGTCISQVKIAG